MDTLNPENAFFNLPPHLAQALGMSLSLRIKASTRPPHFPHSYS